MNLPNALTLLRFAAVPVVAILVLFEPNPWGRWVAAVVFVAASVTDFIDGSLARSRNQVTPLGTLLDPIADKALTGITLIVLSVVGEVAWWITVVIMVREIGITILRLAIAHRTIMPASPGGKTKTVLQIIAITVLLVPLGSVPGWSTLGQVLLFAAMILTVVTGVDYVVRVGRGRGR